MLHCSSCNPFATYAQDEEQEAKAARLQELAAVAKQAEGGLANGTTASESGSALDDEPADITSPASSYGAHTPLVATPTGATMRQEAFPSDENGHRDNAQATFEARLPHAGSGPEMDLSDALDEMWLGKPAGSPSRWRSQGRSPGGGWRGMRRGRGSHAAEDMPATDASVDSAGPIHDELLARSLPPSVAEQGEYPAAQIGSRSIEGNGDRGSSGRPLPHPDDGAGLSPVPAPPGKISVLDDKAGLCEESAAATELAPIPESPSPELLHPLHVVNPDEQTHRSMRAWGSNPASTMADTEAHSTEVSSTKQGALTPDTVSASAEHASQEPSDAVSSSAKEAFEDPYAVSHVGAEAKLGPSLLPAVAADEPVKAGEQDGSQLEGVNVGPLDLVVPAVAAGASDQLEEQAMGDLIVQEADMGEAAALPEEVHAGDAPSSNSGSLPHPDSSHPYIMPSTTSADAANDQGLPAQHSAGVDTPAEDLVSSQESSPQHFLASALLQVEDGGDVVSVDAHASSSTQPQVANPRFDRQSHVQEVGSANREDRDAGIREHGSNEDQSGPASLNEHHQSLQLDSPCGAADGGVDGASNAPGHGLPLPESVVPATAAAASDATLLQARGHLSEEAAEAMVNPSTGPPSSQASKPSRTACLTSVGPATEHVSNQDAILGEELIQQVNAGADELTQKEARKALSPQLHGLASRPGSAEPGDCVNCDDDRKLRTGEAEPPTEGVAADPRAEACKSGVGFGKARQQMAAFKRAISPEADHRMTGINRLAQAGGAIRDASRATTLNLLQSIKQASHQV